MSSRVNRRIHGEIHFTCVLNYIRLMMGANSKNHIFETRNIVGGGGLVFGFAGLLVCRLVCWLVCWLVGWLVGLLAGLLVDWLLACLLYFIFDTTTRIVQLYHTRMKKTTTLFLKIFPLSTGPSGLAMCWSRLWKRRLSGWSRRWWSRGLLSCPGCLSASCGTLSRTSWPTRRRGGSDDGLFAWWHLPYVPPWT